MKLTHFDKAGSARMVDVSEKEVTVRTAVAEGEINMSAETMRLIREGQLSKGDVLQVARIAGIMGAKATPDLIPLCHPIPLDKVEVEFEELDESTLKVQATARATFKTGVEMEALTAATIAGLTVYDMCKSADRAMTLGPFYLVEKTGGKSGHFKREED